MEQMVPEFYKLSACSQIRQYSPWNRDNGGIWKRKWFDLWQVLFLRLMFEHKVIGCYNQTESGWRVLSRGSVWILLVMFADTPVKIKITLPPCCLFASCSAWAAKGNKNEIGINTHQLFPENLWHRVCVERGSVLLPLVPARTSFIQIKSVHRFNEQQLLSTFHASASFE